MPRLTQEFQEEIKQRLVQIYPNPTPIKTEWRAITNIRGLYSPRIDVAVGPFSTIRGGNCIEEYDHLMDLSRRFVEQLLLCHRQNVTAYRILDAQRNEVLEFCNFQELRTFNGNARCLLAIEIEHEVSRKHLLGGAVNAAALGRLGIVIGWTEEKVRALVRLQAYWDFLRSVGKNTFETKNLLILSPVQFRQAIERFRDQAASET